MTEIITITREDIIADLGPSWAEKPKLNPKAIVREILGKRSMTGHDIAEASGGHLVEPDIYVLLSEMVGAGEVATNRFASPMPIVYSLVQDVEPLEPSSIAARIADLDRRLDHVESCLRLHAMRPHGAKKA